MAPTTRSTPWNPVTTTVVQGTTLQSNQTSGPEEVEFKELYKNSSADIMPEYRHYCGIDPIEENMRRVMGKSYTSMSQDQFWANGVIPWSFVSDGDEFAKYAIHTDDKVGLSKGDVETVMAAPEEGEACESSEECEEGEECESSEECEEGEECTSSEEGEEGEEGEEATTSAM